MRLQAYLEKERLSASQFAGRIGRAVSTVTRIINGETTPEPETMAKIVAATGGAVQPNDLFFASRQFDQLAGAGVAEEELVRADFYGLLARFLGGPPNNELLASAAGLSGDASELGNAVSALAAEASLTSATAAAREYQDLFIGLGRGELMPYASYYMTGFLNEKPLAVLRGDLARLGVARAEGAKEPEDNIATLCEVMAGLIGGAFGEPAGLAEQRRFFHTHLTPWAVRFFGDLEAARSARLYRPIGAIGRLFMEVEQAAFAMDA